MFHIEGFSCVCIFLHFCHLRWIIPFWGMFPMYKRALNCLSFCIAFSRVHLLPLGPTGKVLKYGSETHGMAPTHMPTQHMSAKEQWPQPPAQLIPMSLVFDAWGLAQELLLLFRGHGWRCSVASDARDTPHMMDLDGVFASLPSLVCCAGVCLCVSVCACVRASCLCV